MAGSQVAWGLDVGITSLKAIKLRRDGDRVAVEAFDVIEHDKFLSEPDLDKDEVIRRTLQKFLERNPLKRDTVYVGVPGATTFARFVKLPPVQPNRIPEIVRFEAIQQIPFPLDQVNWDYQTFQAPDSPDVEVGIFAMKKDLVAQVMGNFQANQMTISGVQMSPLAVYNAVIYDGLTEDKGTVILDIGAEHTDLIVADQGRLWIRTINIGGNNFTDALAKSFKQPFVRAEQLKRSAATSKYAKQIFQAMRPVFADLVAEIQRSIGHYNSSHRDSRLERILGMGNPFKLPNLQKYLQQELKLDVVRLEGFKRANTDGRLAAGLSENVLSLTTAYGLALQGLELAAIDTSLLPVEIARQMVWRKKRIWFAGAAAAVLIGTASLGVRAWWDDAAWTEAETARRANNGRVQQALTLTNALKRQTVTFDSDRAAVDSYMKLAGHRKVWPQVLGDIYGSLPQHDAKKIAADPTRLIALQSISSEYSDQLSRVVFSGTSTGGANTREEAAPVAGPSDKGFAIVISGYTPNQSGLDLLREYKNQLEQRANEKLTMQATDKQIVPAKPYYIGDNSLKFKFMPFGGSKDSAGGSGPRGIWGMGQRGPFWSVFVPDMQGVVPMTVLPGTLDMRPVEAEQPVDAMFELPLKQKPPRLLIGSYMFEMSFKIYVR